jgi:hypothetical protein
MKKSCWWFSNGTFCLIDKEFSLGFQDIIVRQDDCMAKHGIVAFDIKEGKEFIGLLCEDLIGRYLCKNFIDSKTEKVLILKDYLITNKNDDLLVNFGIKKLKLAQVLEVD